MDDPSVDCVPFGRGFAADTLAVPFLGFRLDIVFIRQGLTRWRVLVMPAPPPLSHGQAQFSSFPNEKRSLDFETLLHCFLGGGTGDRSMIFTALSPLSADTHFTVTFDFNFGLPPSTTVSVVMANVRTVGFPKTFCVSVMLSALSAVTTPAKN